MSIREIYLSLCDLYFWDLRPAAALEKLQSLNENSHLFKNIAEAANTLTRWAKLASLASPNYGSQRILMYTYFREALMKIMPRDLKVHVITRIDEIAGMKGDDLDPIELVKALSRYRNFIDTAFEKGVTNKNKRNHQNQIKLLSSAPSVDTVAPAPLLALPAPAPSPSQPAASESDKPKQTGKKGKKNEEKKAKAKAAKAAKASQPSSGDSNANANTTANGNTSSKCKLCGNSSHKSNECPLFPGDRGNIANNECRRCKAKLFHFTKFCPLNVEVPKN